MAVNYNYRNQNKDKLMVLFKFCLSKIIPWDWKYLITTLLHVFL